MNIQPKYKIDNARLSRLVAKAQNGSRKAMEDVINMVSGYLYYYSLTLLGDEEQAKDAVQDILLTILKKLDTLDEPKAFLGWMKTIAANYCKTKLSRTKEHISIDEDTWEFADENDQICPEKSAETEEVCGYVREAVRALPQLLRESVMMFYFNQMSVKQIADILEVNENTVKSRLYSARQSMKKYLEKYGGAALASCAVPPMSVISFSLIQGAERQKNILIPYATQAGEIKVAAVNPSSASASLPIKAAAVGAACLITAGGIGAAVMSGKSNADNPSEPFTAPSSHTYIMTQPSSTEPTEPTAAETTAQTVPVSRTVTDNIEAGTQQPQENIAETTVYSENATQAPSTQTPSTAEQSDTPLYSQIIRIQVAEDTFSDFDRMYCFLTDKTADTVLADWGSIKGTMSKIENTDTWSISLARQNITLYSGHRYSVVFTSDWSTQTDVLEFTASGNTREHVAVYTGESTPISYTANTYSYKYKWLGE